MAIATSTALLIAAGSALVGSGVKAHATSRAGKRAAQAQEDQTQAALDFDRQIRRETQSALNSFSYSFDAENPYLGLEQYYQSLPNQFDNLENFVSEVDNAYAGLRNEYNALQNQFEGLPNNYDGLENQFEGLETAFQNVENAYERVDNPFSGQQVPLQDIEFRQEQANQNFANIADSIQQGGGINASSATALAASAGNTQRELAGEIARRESQQQQQFAGAEFQRQQLVAQGQQNLNFARAGATDRFTTLEAQGAQALDFARAQEQGRLNTLRAQGAQQLDFARAGAGQRNQELFLGQEQQLNLLSAQQAQQNQQQQLAQATQLDLLGAQEQSQQQLLEREGEIYRQNVLADRDANALEINLAGYSAPGQSSPSAGYYNQTTGNTPNPYDQSQFYAAGGQQVPQQGTNQPQQQQGFNFGQAAAGTATDFLTGQGLSLRRFTDPLVDRVLPNHTFLGQVYDGVTGYYNNQQNQFNNFLNRTGG